MASNQNTYANNPPTGLPVESYRTYTGMSYSGSERRVEHDKSGGANGVSNTGSDGGQAHESSGGSSSSGGSFSNNVGQSSDGNSSA